MIIFFFLLNIDLNTQIGSRKSDLESIDENESTFSASVTSSLISVNTLLNRYSQTHNRAKGNKPKRKHQTAGELSQSQSIPILGLEPLPSIVTKGDSRAIISPSIIHPSDHTSSSEEILTFRVEEDDEEEKDTQSVVSRTRQMDCETPRVITWTDLSYDPNEYHQIEFTKSLQLESLSVDKNDNKEEYVVATSRSDQSDYEIEWDRANRKIH